MKLEGWIAVDKDGEGDWVADSSPKQLIETMEKQGEKYAIDWKDPIPCTITIPDSKEAQDG
jgi:hypothetical protein